MSEMLHGVGQFYKKHSIPILIAAFGIVLVLPHLMSSSYLVGILCKLLLYTILAGSLNVICGFSDMFCLGHMAFYCLGAYTSAILSTRTELPFLLILFLGGLLAALFGMMVFFPIRNLGGAWLALVTIGFSEIVRLTALNWDSLTGGATGVKYIPYPTILGIEIADNTGFYYLFLIFAILFVFITGRIIKSRVGFAWMSIKENSLAARSLGVEVTRYKALNFFYGTFWAGIAGALLAPFMMYIDSTIFTLDEGFSILCMVLIGGLGTIVGPIAGSVIVIFLTEALRFLSNYRMVIYGLVIILMMWVRPQGMFGSAISNLPKAFNFKKREGRRA